MGRRVVSIMTLPAASHNSPESWYLRYQQGKNASKTVARHERSALCPFEASFSSRNHLLNRPKQLDLHDAAPTGRHVFFGACL